MGDGRCLGLAIWPTVGIGEEKAINGGSYCNVEVENKERRFRWRQGQEVCGGDDDG